MPNQAGSEAVVGLAVGPEAAVGLAVGPEAVVGLAVGPEPVAWNWLARYFARPKSAPSRLS